MSLLVKSRYRFPWETSPRTTLTAGAAVVLVGYLLLLGLFALTVGVIDAVSAGELVSRVLGMCLAAGGIVCLGAAGGLYLERDWGAWLGVVAGVIGVVIGTMLFVAGWRGNSQLLVVWVAVAVVSLLVLIVLWRARERSLEPRVKKVLLAVSSFVGAAVLISVGQFYYVNFVLPGQVAPSLSVTVDLEKVAETDDFVGLVANVEIENKSNTKVVVLSSIYRLTGRTVVEERRGDLSQRIADAATSHDLRTYLAIPPGDLFDTPISAYAKPSRERLVETGQVLYGHSWFEPNQTYVRHFTVIVPKAASFDIAAFAVHLVVAKGGALEVTTPDQPSSGPKKVDDPPFSYVLTEWPIHETSLIRRLTRAPRYLRAFLILEDDQRPGGDFPQPLVDVSYGSGELLRDTADEYFLGNTISVAELSLWKPEVPSSGAADEGAGGER